MSSANPEIKSSIELRDKIFEFLPPKALGTLLGVSVKYWPVNAAEIELVVTYDALDGLLDVTVHESIYGPGGTIAGSIVRGCELDADTGEVHAYDESMTIPGENKTFDPKLKEFMQDVNTFDASKLEFLLRLFESL